MTTAVKNDLVKLVKEVAQVTEIPPIRRIYLPEPETGPDRHTQFGVVVLEDGAAGLYYAWLGDEQKGMDKRFDCDSFVGQDAISLLRYFESDNEADRSLGLAAINAITQSVFRQKKYVPDTATDSMGALDIDSGDHVGMVGYFPSLVKGLSEHRVRLTVIEKKTQFAEKTDLLEVTPELEKLIHCNKVMVTASTLLNDSIDAVLGCTNQADTVVVVGPSAGFFPDPLFERGVAAVGGSSILNADIAIEHLMKDEGLGDQASKYLLRKSEYPGVARLLGLSS